MNIYGFSLGFGLGALLALLVAWVWSAAHDKYQEISWTIEEWRRIQENEKLTSQGRPPKPLPIEMGLSKADERMKRKTINKIRRQCGPDPEPFDGYRYYA